MIEEIAIIQADKYITVISTLKSCTVSLKQIFAQLQQATIWKQKVSHHHLKVLPSGIILNDNVLRLFFMIVD